jgi:nucleoside triphosphate pyrophosphatase
MQRVVLASASPRRAELLRAAGIEFDVVPADVDERPRERESPEAYVRRVAEAKARAVMPAADGRPVLAADTVVVVDDVILGKPASREDAGRMLRMLSGRTHEVVTGVTLASAAKVSTAIESSSVEFLPLTPEEIEWYVATGEPDDKAGAYAIQGYASRFITRISGSYSNVVGLPISLVYTLLKQLAL